MTATGSAGRSLPIAIPHAAPLRLICGEVQLLSGDRFACTAQVPKDGPAVTDGHLRSAYLIEALAQACAAWAAATAVAESSISAAPKPVAGLLVRVDQARVQGRTAAGSTLTLRCQAGPALGDLRQCNGMVLNAEGDCIAAARLTLSQR